MSESKGFILRLSEARAETFKTRRDPNHFAEAVPEFDYSRNRVLPCFVVDAKNRITHLADASRGVRAGEQQRRLNLRCVEELKPLALSDIRSGLPTKLVNAFDKQVQRTGLVSPKVFDAMIERLTTLRPETTSILGQFSQARRRRLLALPRVASDNLALQKEAVATALSIAGISRDELTGWDYDEALGTGTARPVFPSFIAGLPKVRLREDQMLAHDLATFPGYQALATSGVAATAFSNGTHDLTVILANRLPLENQTGADLIYYNRTFRCFLMVQYKAMELESEVDDVDEDMLVREALYRFPDKQLTEELERMDELLAAFKHHATDNSVDGFRLTTNPFFLKVCPRLRFDADDAGMSKGMYLPLDYWKLLSEHPSMLGPKGGKRLMYSNVRRYMDNTQFATVVAGGWVGTNMEQAAFLEQVIAKVLESGKAAVVAIDDVRDERHRKYDADAPLSSPDG